MPRPNTRFLRRGQKSRGDQSVHCEFCAERFAASGSQAEGSTETRARKRPKRNPDGQMTLSQENRVRSVFGTALAPAGPCTGPLEPTLYRGHFVRDKTVDLSEPKSMKQTIKFDWSKMKPKHVEVRFHAANNDAEDQISTGDINKNENDLDNEKENLSSVNEDRVNSSRHDIGGEVNNFRTVTCNLTGSLLHQSSGEATAYLWSRSSTEATASLPTNVPTEAHAINHGTAWAEPNDREMYSQEQEGGNMAQPWPLAKSFSLRSLGSPLACPYNFNQSNATELNTNSTEINLQHDQEESKRNSETYSLSEKRVGEDAPEREVPISTKPSWLLKKSSHTLRSYCSIQNLHSPNINSFSPTAPSAQLSGCRGHSEAKWANYGGGESNQVCSFSPEEGVHCNQAVFSGAIGEGEAAVNSLVSVSAGAMSADTETLRMGKELVLTEDTEVECTDRDLRNSARALCSYRFWHKGVKNLLLQEVSQTSRGEYSVEGVRSLSSNGVTISEPAGGYDDTSDVSSSDSECSPSPKVVIEGSEILREDHGTVPEDAYSVMKKHSTPILFEGGRTVLCHNTTEGSTGTHHEGDRSAADDSMDPDQQDMARSAEMPAPFAVAKAECNDTDNGQKENSRPHVLNAGIDVTQEDKFFHDTLETVECNGSPCSDAGLQQEQTMQIDTVWHQLPSSQTLFQDLRGPGEDKYLPEEHMNEENHCGVCADNSMVNAPGTVSETCSSWSTLIDFVQNRSVCPVLSPVLRYTEDVSQGICNDVSIGCSNRAVQYPRILDLRKENDSSEESFVIDAGVSHTQESAVSAYLTHPASVRMGPSQNGSSSESQASQQPEAGTSGVSLDGVNWDMPGRCSDVLNEALPLREVWQTMRQQGVDHNLDVESEDDDAVANDEAVDPEAEPAAARTASSLELEQNLQMAKVAALQNMSSACPYMPWTGNLGTEASYRRLGAAAGKKRESWSEYSTASAEFCTGADRDRTVVIVDSTHSMEEGESVENAVMMENERIHRASRRDSLSRVGPCTQYGRSRRESHSSRHHPYSSQQRTSERRWSRSPVKGRGGSNSIHLTSRSPASSSSDVASVCPRSACARRQYMAPDSASTSNSWVSTRSPLRHRHARVHPKHGHSFRPTAYRRQCCRRSGRSLSRNLSVPTRIRIGGRVWNRSGRSLSPHIGMRTRVQREARPVSGKKIKMGPSFDSDSDTESGLHSYGSAGQRVTTRFSPPSRRRGVRFNQLRRVDIFPTSPLTSALMHNRSNNTNSLSSTTFQQAADSLEQTRHSERQGVGSVAHCQQVSFNPPSPQDPGSTPEGNTTDTPGSPRLPIFSMHTHWHSFVKSSVTDTPPWSFRASNTTFFNTDKQQPRGSDHLPAKNSPPGKKRHAVSAFSGVDPSKRDRQELVGETDLVPSMREERRIRLEMRGDSGTNARRHDNGRQQFRRQASRVSSCSHCDRHRRARHNQELLYKQARAVLRGMCYLRSKEELLFQAAIRFQYKRLQLQEQHSRLVNRARAVGQNQFRSGCRPYRSPSTKYALYRHRCSYKHRRHRAHTCKSHCDVTSGTLRSCLKDRKSSSKSGAEKLLDQPSTSRGPVRKRKHADYRCSCRKRPRLARNVVRDRDSESSASRSSPLMHRKMNKNYGASGYNADDENEENDEEDEENDEDDDDDRCRLSDWSEDDDEGSENNDDDEDAADDGQKKSGDRLDEEAKSEESSDEESDSPRNAGFYREQ